MTEFNRNYGADVRAVFDRVNALIQNGAFEGSFDTHHVVPVAVGNESGFIRLDYGIDQYQQRFNSLDNVIVLPKDRTDAAGLGMEPHRGHSQYRDAIERVHQQTNLSTRQSR